RPQRIEVRSQRGAVRNLEHELRRTRADARDVDDTGDACDFDRGHSANILMPVAAAKLKRYASFQSGCRTITCPSDSNVFFQFRRGVPGRNNLSSTNHGPASFSQFPSPSMRVTRPLPSARLNTMPQLYLRSVDAS